MGQFSVEKPVAPRSALSGMKRLSKASGNKTDATMIECALIAWTIIVVMINMVAASGAAGWHG
jgi:hypothetical protein